MKVDRILVPTDFSPGAEEALEHAIEFARTFSAEIHLVHSFATNPGCITPYSPGVPYEMIAAIRKAAASRLTEEVETVKQAGIEVREHLVEEHPSQAIASVAEQIEADLIIMGTRGLTGLKHIMLGSVAERVVRIAPCPVLTVGGKSD